LLEQDNGIFKEKTALLQWDSAPVNNVVAVLSGTIDFPLPRPLQLCDRRTARRHPLDVGGGR
jgi:hypothetical protein